MMFVCTTTYSQKAKKRFTSFFVVLAVQSLNSCPEFATQDNNIILSAFAKAVIQEKNFFPRFYLIASNSVIHSL